MSKHIRKTKKKNSITFLSNNTRFNLLFFLFIGIILLYFPTTLWHFPDGIGYYSYMPAVFKYRNYDFYSIMKTYKLNLIGMGKRGFIMNDFDIGYSLICCPVYLFSKIFENETISILMTNFFSSLLGLSSLLLIYRFLTKSLFLDKHYSITICICLLTGTPLLFYSYSIPQNPHTILAFLCSLYFYILFNLYEKEENLKNHLLLGLLLGVICSVRLQRIILAIPLIIEIILRVVKTKKIKVYSLFILAFVVSFIVGLSPQLINLTIQFGSIMPPKIYTLSINKYIFSSAFEVLFSSYHSVLLWTPLILISLFGFILNLKSNLILSIKILLIFFAEILIISAVISPGGGASFGIRYLTDLVFLTGLGLYLILKLTKQKLIKLVKVVIYICSMWTFILFILSDLNKIDLLEVYSIDDFFSKVLSGIKTLSITIKPRYSLDIDLYIFLIFILIFVIFMVKQTETIYKDNTKSKLFLLILTTYILFFNINLINAGIINRIVYKRDTHLLTLTQEDYQRIYSLAGIKVRLKYYNMTRQKNKFDYYLALKNQLWPKTKLGKIFANALFSDFKIN